jgi:hypothetical protein
MKTKTGSLLAIMVFCVVALAKRFRTNPMDFGAVLGGRRIARPGNEIVPGGERDRSSRGKNAIEPLYTYSKDQRRSVLGTAELSWVQYHFWRGKFYGMSAGTKSFRNRTT